MDGNRVASAVADLLRQLGALPGAAFDKMPKTANLPADMQALGVWICGNNMPMLVHLASQEQIDDGMRRLQIMLPVGVQGGEWYSYPEALLKMSQNEIDGVARNPGTRCTEEYAPGIRGWPENAQRSSTDALRCGEHQEGLDRVK